MPLLCLHHSGSLLNHHREFCRISVLFKAPETAAGVVMIFWFIAVELAYTIGASTRTSLCVVMIAVEIESLPRQAKDLQKENAGG